jgi:hypothetical protein
MTRIGSQRQSYIYIYVYLYIYICVCIYIYIYMVGAVFFKNFSLPLFAHMITFTSVSLVSLCKYLFKLFKEKIS